MNYKVLYRKYRPDDFNNVVGQDYIITTLKNSIKSGNISHAYIFSGPRGTGKTSTAKIFAKAINCLNPVDGNPCGECEFCKNYNENPDIIEIDAASHNGVDQIRELIDNVKLIPSNGKYKVYIIDEVHMLSINAFNALLLTLEEPPKHVIFIFATTNIENVPITILSRCQRYNFCKIPIQTIIDRLKNIRDIEKIDIEDEAINEIAYISEGGLRDALSILDQVSKFDGKITLSLIQNDFKIVSNNDINKIIKYFDEDDSEKLIEFLTILKNTGSEYKFLIKKIINSLVKYAENIKLNRVKSIKSYSVYYDVILELIDTLNKININVDPFITLELILLKYMNVESSSSKPKVTLLNEDSSSNVEKKDGALEEKDELNKIETKILDNSVSNSLIDIRINNCFVGAKKSELESVRKLFKEYIDTGKFDKSITSILTDTNPVAASKDYVIFSTDNIRIADNLNEKRIYIEELLNKKVVFITIDKWTSEKEKYIKNIKAGISYQLQDENTCQNEEENISNGVFSSSKIEII